MRQTIITLPALMAFLPAVLGAPSSQDSAAICGSKGYDDGTDAYGYSNKGTYAGCSAACQKDPTHCKSFSYGNGDCNLYNVAVAGNFDKDSSSPYTFYDVSCVVASTTTASSTTTGKLSTSTTTKTSTIVTTTTSKVSTLTTTTTNKSTTKSTTKATITTTTASTTSVTTISSTTATPPCPLPTWTIHDFTFINSSHNLDCAGADAGSNLCYTGLPAQPEGYGPPDSVTVTVDGIGSCHQQNPGSVPLRSIGDNVVRCGGSAYQLSFYGNSNSPSSLATFNIQNGFSCGDGKSYAAWASVQVAMNCVYDSGRNATCTMSPSSVVVPATGFAYLT